MNNGWSVATFLFSLSPRRGVWVLSDQAYCTSRPTAAHVVCREGVTQRTPQKWPSKGVRPARSTRLWYPCVPHTSARRQRWGCLVRRGRWSRAEEKLPPTSARRPLAGGRPSSPAAGRQFRGPFGRFRHMLGSFRVRGGARLVLFQCARAPRSDESRGGPPLPPGPAPAPPPPCECRQRRLPRLESACWRSAKKEGGGRGGRRAGRKAGSGSGASVRARRGSYGRTKGDRAGAGAAASPGRRPSGAPVASRRLAAPTPLCAEGWRMSSPGSG